MAIFVVAGRRLGGDDAENYVVAFSVWRGEVGRFDGAEEVRDQKDGSGGEGAG